MALLSYFQWGLDIIIPMHACSNTPVYVVVATIQCFIVHRPPITLNHKFWQPSFIQSVEWSTKLLTSECVIRRIKLRWHTLHSRDKPLCCGGKLDKTCQLLLLVVPKLINSCLKVDWLIIYVLRPAQEYFTYIETSPLAGEGLQNLGLCSALRAFEQGGIFFVPHLLWHGTSVFPVSSEGPPHSVASYDTQGEVEDLF